MFTRNSTFSRKATKCRKVRVKPWGTGHAILCAAEAIDGAPFAVINSDDYYGRTAFEEIYRQLTTEQDGATYQYAMVAYDLYKTLTDNGT